MGGQPEAASSGRPVAVGQREAAMSRRAAMVDQGKGWRRGVEAGSCRQPLLGGHWLAARPAVDGH